MAYRKEKTKFEEQFSKKFRSENNLKTGNQRRQNKTTTFNEHVSEIIYKNYESDEHHISKNKKKAPSDICSKKEILNRYFEDGKLNAKYLHKNDYAGKRLRKEKMTGEISESITSESKEQKKQIGNINQDIKNQVGSSDMTNVWMVHTCGPDRCSMDQDDMFSRVTEPEGLEKLEEYNNTSFPFPVKNKYLEILKVYDFPFDKIGPFNESKAKEKKCNIKPPVPLVQRTIDEANELFLKAGYEDELVEWLRRVFKIYPRPEDPHDYLKYNSGGGQDMKNRSEYIQYLEELKHLLAFENELSFELAQIKLLCAMVDEEAFGCDGKTRAEWNSQIRTMLKNKTLSKIKCLSTLHSNVTKEIKQEKKHIAEEKAAAKKAVRDQILRDLPIWKQYLAPITVTTRQKEDDGRIDDWFRCLRFPDTEGKSQAPVYEFDDIEAYKKETFDELKSRSSSLLEEDFK